MSQVFASGGQSIEVSAWATILPMNIPSNFLYDRLVGSPCSPRDSQESSPTPQFKSINSSALNFFFFWCPFLFTCSYPRLSSLQSFKLFISKLPLHLLLHPYFLYIRTSAPGALFKIVPVGRTGTFHIFWDHPWVYCAFLMHTHMHSFNVYWKPTLCANCFARVWESKRKKEQSS